MKNKKGIAEEIHCKRICNYNNNGECVSGSEEKDLFGINCMAFEPKTFKLPVTWECYGMVEIEADTIEDAVMKFEETEEDIPLPTESDYVEGNFRLSADYDDIEYFKQFN